MTSDRTRHEALAGAALRRLGRAPAGASPTVRLLAGGLSGSTVYRLDLAGEDVVLKVTPPGAGRRLLARARREARFYRDLATRVPVTVPRVLGLDLDGTDGVVVLLAAHAPSPPPDRWPDHAFAQVAGQLGRLHATFRVDTAALAMPGWLRAKPPVTPAQCHAAAKVWRALGERDDLRAALVSYRRSRERLLAEIPALDPRPMSVPATLCHGDCHPGNLLWGPAGEWIWVDWQEVRLGPGVDDLVFFWQRAFAETGTSPPYEAMARAYGVGWETAGGDPIPRKRLDQALSWSELRSWLVDWPGYYGALPAARMECILRRIGALMVHLEVAGHP